MKAVVCHHGDFAVQDVPEPEPGKGQILLNVLRCGICGSDLHARHHIEIRGLPFPKSVSCSYKCPTFT